MELVTGSRLIINAICQPWCGLLVSRCFENFRGNSSLGGSLHHLIYSPYIQVLNLGSLALILLIVVGDLVFRYFEVGTVNLSVSQIILYRSLIFLSRIIQCYSLIFFSSIILYSTLTFFFSSQILLDYLLCLSSQS